MLNPVVYDRSNNELKNATNIKLNVNGKPGNITLIAFSNHVYFTWKQELRTNLRQKTE